jgi:predicted RNA methylase
MTSPPAGPDIFAGQPGDPDLLAEIYDLEHDEVIADFAFYRLLTARDRGPVLDLGCGSGRLFLALIEGGASTLTGVDGSPALVRI